MIDEIKSALQGRDIYELIDDSEIALAGAIAEHQKGKEGYFLVFKGGKFTEVKTVNGRKVEQSPGDLLTYITSPLSFLKRKALELILSGTRKQINKMPELVNETNPGCIFYVSAVSRYQILDKYPQTPKDPGPDGHLLEVKLIKKDAHGKSWAFTKDLAFMLLGEARPDFDQKEVDNQLNLF